MDKLIKPSDYKPSKKCNGCGTGWNRRIVPDSIYFLNVRDICCIHDHMYEVGTSKLDKDIADLVFKLNLHKRIDNDTNMIRNIPFIKNRMRAIADSAVFVVQEFGDDAFWKGKDNVGHN